MASQELIGAHSFPFAPSGHNNIIGGGGPAGGHNRLLLPELQNSSDMGGIYQELEEQNQPMSSFNNQGGASACFNDGVGVLDMSELFPSQPFGNTNMMLQPPLGGHQHQLVAQQPTIPTI